MIPHFLFFSLVSIIVLIVLYIERKDIKKYIVLGTFTILLGLVFETTFASMGFWIYYSEPRFLGVSVFTIFLYFHYSILSYFFGNRLYVVSKHG